jgi:hypothetical protein
MQRNRPRKGAGDVEKVIDATDESPAWFEGHPVYGVRTLFPAGHRDAILPAI